MGDQAYLTAVFDMANGKRGTIHLDFRKADVVTNIGTDFDQQALELLVQAAYDGWSGTPNLRENFPATIALNHVEAFAYTMVANPSAPPPFHRVPEAGPYGSAGPAVNGTDAGDPVPPQVALVVSFRTALISKSGRGRVYLPAVSELVVGGNGYIDSAFDTQLTTDFDEWVEGIQNSAIPSESITHIVASQTTGDYQEVTSRFVRNRVDTQRRRLTRLES